MNSPLILKLSATLLVSGCQLAHASADERRVEARGSKRSHPSSPGSVVGSRSGEIGTVHYDRRQVWKGPLQHELRTVGKCIDGTEYAAAWDGPDLLWENVPGAARKLG